MRLQGRTAIVTGAGRGLGTELARALASEGMALALVSRTGEQVQALARELASVVPDQALLPVAMDVRDPAAVDRLVRTVEQRLGSVDLLVNNAAAIEHEERPFWQADPAELWDVVETNLRGPMLLTHAVLPAMVARGSGRIVNVTSRARAATATGTYTAYAVSKRALSVLTESLGQALQGTGVVVVDLLPGLVRTSMTAAMPVWRDVPEQEWDRAEVSARLLVDIALGVHDAAAGTVLDAPALARAGNDPYGRILP